VTAFWRRQGVLVLLAGGLFALSWTLVGAVEQTEPVRWLADGTPTHAFDTAALRRLTLAVGAAGVAAAALLAIAVWHVARVLMLFKEQHGNLG
jgi:hypothetical protein